MKTPAMVQLIERIAGLTLERGGMSAALDRHVTERMRALGLRRVEDYLAQAALPGEEQRLLIDAITVRHTWFFRDPEQLQVVAKLVVAATSDPVSVWVAGCATGEEAYTIAMIGRRVGRNLRVHATDINEGALAFARRGVYSAVAAENVPELERHWLSPCEGGFVVDPVLRQTITFERHNLIDLPPRGEWDLVVCRNVLIYFALGPATRVFERFARALREGGSLVLGAGEIVTKPPPGLEMAPMGNRLVLRRSGAPVIPSSGATVRALAAATPGALPVVAKSIPVALTGMSPRSERPDGPGRPDGPERPERDEELVAALSRGHALFERGQIGPAIAVYDDLSRRHPSVAEVWLFLGIARYVHNDFDGAVKALRSSRCLEPRLWPAVFYLGRACERLGYRAEARQLFELLAVDGLRPIELQSVSAMINELRAFQHDFQTAARRLARERPARTLRDPWAPWRAT